MDVKITNKTVYRVFEDYQSDKPNIVYMGLRDLFLKKKPATGNVTKIDFHFIFILIFPTKSKKLLFSTRMYGMNDSNISFIRYFSE